MSAVHQLEVRFAAAPADKPSAYYKGDVMRVNMLDQQSANMAVSKIQAGRDDRGSRMVHFLDESGLMWTMDSWRVVYARALRFETPSADGEGSAQAPDRGEA